MEDFQIRAKNDDFPELKEWPWYVDDSVLKCKRIRSSEILNHLNSIEESINFTKEEEENNTLPALDLGLNVDRKRKKIEFNVHYKKTNTNITIKKRSNNTESTKRGVIKGFAERARKYCDPRYLKTELDNIVDVFEDNGYSREEVVKAMNHQKRENKDEVEDAKRGIVVLPNIPKFTYKLQRNTDSKLQARRKEKLKT